MSPVRGEIVLLAFRGHRATPLGTEGAGKGLFAFPTSPTFAVRLHITAGLTAPSQVESTPRSGSTSEQLWGPGSLRAVVGPLRPLGSAVQSHPVPAAGSKSRSGVMSVVVCSFFTVL